LKKSFLNQKEEEEEEEEGRMKNVAIK